MRATEAVATAAGAAALGFVTWGIAFGTVIGIVAAVFAAINGLLSGLRQVYAWRTVAGWYAFVVDASWALIGTTLGTAVNVANLFWKNATYRPDLSHRRNRHVFDHGFRVSARYANTQGCVISNARVGNSERRILFLDRHEDLHIWQNRWFGPVYQGLYLAWLIGGSIVGLVAWAVHSQPKPPLKRLVETVAYYDCPFEYWAYRNDEHWADNSSPVAGLRWG